MAAAAKAGDEQRWSVGALAAELGVTTRTLRHYEAEGLISPQRVGANRTYTARDRARMRLILRGRRFGMTLAECREIVDIYDGAAHSERRQLELLLTRLDEIGADLRDRQRDLARTLSEVSDVRTQCRVRLDELNDLDDLGDVGDTGGSAEPADVGDPPTTR